MKLRRKIYIKSLLMCSCLLFVYYLVSVPLKSIYNIGEGVVWVGVILMTPFLIVFSFLKYKLGFFEYILKSVDFVIKNKRNYRAFDRKWMHKHLRPTECDSNIMKRISKLRRALM